MGDADIYRLQRARAWFGRRYCSAVAAGAGVVWSAVLLGGCDERERSLVGGIAQRWRRALADNAGAYASDRPRSRRRVRRVGRVRHVRQNGCLRPQTGVDYGNSPRLVIIVLIVLPVLLSPALPPIACIRASVARPPVAAVPVCKRPSAVTLEPKVHDPPWPRLRRDKPRTTQQGAAVADHTILRSCLSIGIAFCEGSERRGALWGARLSERRARRGSRRPHHFAKLFEHRSRFAREVSEGVHYEVLD